MIFIKLLKLLDAQAFVMKCDSVSLRSRPESFRFFSGVLNFFHKNKIPAIFSCVRWSFGKIPHSSAFDVGVARFVRRRLPRCIRRERVRSRPDRVFKQLFDRRQRIYRRI